MSRECEHEVPFEYECEECVEDSDTVKALRADAAHLTSERDAALAEVAELRRSLRSYEKAHVKLHEYAGIKSVQYTDALEERDQARSALSEALAALRKLYDAAKAAYDDANAASTPERFESEGEPWLAYQQALKTFDILDDVMRDPGLDTALRKGEERDG